MDYRNLNYLQLTEINFLLLQQEVRRQKREITLNLEGELHFLQKKKFKTKS